MRVFVAGATGVIGRYLVPGLVTAGHEVTGSTRSPAKAGQLEEQGATPVMFIAQSFVGWTNGREGGTVKTETDPLDPHPLAVTASTLAAIRHLEEVVPKTVPEGLVLRYGILYGHGASDAMLEAARKRQLPVVGGGAGVWSFTELTDAAAATVAAVTRGAPGIYNVVDDDPAPVAQWLPYLASSLGAKPPMHAPAWLGRLLGGEMTVSMMTEVRGASNEKAKRELGWTPAYPSWRDGFPVWTEAYEAAHVDAA